MTSAAHAGDFPGDGAPEIALVGRSNVGKSSLINALVRDRLARTSAAPGKTRLANIYSVARGSAAPFYLVDLPGYGYARGGRESADEFEALTTAYFGSACGHAEPRTRESEARRQRQFAAGVPPSQGFGEPGRSSTGSHSSGGRGPRRQWKKVGALLLVDARHPGLISDRAAWQWIHGAVAGAAIVATKIDKLARGGRIRALRELESVFENSVLPVSAVTGEGLDELWKLIDRLLTNPNLPLPRRPREPAAPPQAPPRRRRRPKN